MLQTTENTTACDKHTNCDKHLQIVTNTKKERKQKNVNSNFGALYFFCYDLGSHRCLTVTNLLKTIIWIQNIHQVSLTKSNLLKWTTLILKSVCIFQRSQRGKRGFVIHLVGFTFFYLSNMYWLYSLQPCGFCGI